MTDENPQLTSGSRAVIVLHAAASFASGSTLSTPSSSRARTVWSSGVSFPPAEQVVRMTSPLWLRAARADFKPDTVYGRQFLVNHEEAATVKKGNAKCRFATGSWML